MRISASRSRQTLVTVGILFAFSLVLSAYSTRHPGLASGIADVISESVSPLQRVVTWSVGSVRSVLSNYVTLVGIQVDNMELGLRLRALEVQVLQSQEIERENAALRELLSLPVQEPIKLKAARVIGYETAPWRQQVVIDAGESQGVTVGTAVVYGHSVVGQVIQVSFSRSIVMLVTDPQSGIDALSQQHRSRGVLEGTGTDHCRLRYVSREDAVTRGDRIITSGLDGVFPKGFVLGSIYSIQTREDGSLFHDVEVVPAAPLDKLEVVSLVQKGASQ